MIIPAYNEENRLPTMLRETIDVLKDRKKTNPSYKYEIIIVDDGSKDKTTQVALKYSNEISVENCRVLTLGKLLILHLDMKEIKAHKVPDIPLPSLKL